MDPRKRHLIDLMNTVITAQVRRAGLHPFAGFREQRTAKLAVEEARHALLEALDALPLQHGPTPADVERATDAAIECLAAVRAAMRRAA